MDDEQIIDLFWKRQEAAISAAEEAYGSYCFSIADNILHSREDSEECVSDTWLRVWQSIPPQRPVRLRLFLAKITRNLAFDRYRMRSAAKRGSGEIDSVLEELEDCIAAPEDVEQEYDRRDLQRCINTFLKTLSYRERQLFLRRYFYAEPVKEIARDFGIGGNHASVILKRTRSKLREHLKKEGFLE